ncbi:hypothetical protein IRJ41_014010 [Triplophysa rosa]|uniref:Immunoglobulin domain-containing protein n=1 Tax=Triplophysa rosa TaxID=992332 RepID=A0A9W7TFV2_TRIRA|nr:hypothetical protein IRJ41_014010 [Triplophysa rosa]
MYPVTVQRSLLVAFLLSLKGSYIHSADDICAPVGSTALLSCPHKCSKIYTWTLDWKPIQLKSDQNKYSENKKNCSLTIQNLNKMDRGTYRYCKTDHDDDDDDSDEEGEDFCTYTLYITDLQVNADVDRVTEDVMIDSTGIILLSSLLVLLTLMLIGAAVWRRRNNLRRREGNESNTQLKIKHGL